jgi:hypothetical protein
MSISFADPVSAMVKRLLVTVNLQEQQVEGETTESRQTGCCGRVTKTSPSQGGQRPVSIQTTAQPIVRAQCLACCGPNNDAEVSWLMCCRCDTKRRKGNPAMPSFSSMFTHRLDTTVTGVADTITRAFLLHYRFPCLVHANVASFIMCIITKTLYTVCCHSRTTSQACGSERDGRWRPKHTRCLFPSPASPSSRCDQGCQDSRRQHAIEYGFCPRCTRTYAPLNLQTEVAVLSYWCFKNQMEMKEPVPAEEVPLAECIKDAKYLALLLDERVDRLELTALAREMSGFCDDETNEMRRPGSLVRYVQTIRAETLARVRALAPFEPLSPLTSMVSPATTVATVAVSPTVSIR